MFESILRREIQEIRRLFEDREEKKVLKEILCELRHIRHQLEPKFTLHINPKFTGKDYVHWRLNMPSIVAGQSGTFVLSATASDNSTVVLANPQLTADDSAVTIVADNTDLTGLTFAVTVPASDTQTSFNLNATADATSDTSPTPQSISASLSVTISPATVPVTFTLAINQK